MLRDEFFLWPKSYGAGLAQAIADITPLLSKSAVAGFLGGNACGNLAEFIALECRNRNVSPWWLMVCAQREQSVFGKQFLKPAEMAAWLGVTNSDYGRTKLPGYYGIYAQVVRCTEVTAWLLNVEPLGAWPAVMQSSKSSRRFKTGLTVAVDQDGMPDGKGGVLPVGSQKEVMPLSRGDYMQLSYTPHMRVLALNEELAKKYTPMQYL